MQAAEILCMQVMNRAVLAGQLLAHVLMSGAHGGRPVTLIGFSMGARCDYELPPEILNINKANQAWVACQQKCALQLMREYAYAGM